MCPTVQIGAFLDLVERLAKFFRVTLLEKCPYVLKPRSLEVVLFPFGEVSLPYRMRYEVAPILSESTVHLRHYSRYEVFKHAILIRSQIRDVRTSAPEDTGMLCKQFRQRQLEIHKCLFRGSWD